MIDDILYNYKISFYNLICCIFKVKEILFWENNNFACDL